MSFASSSSSSMAPAGGSLGESVSEKLTTENFMIWKAQVMPAIRGAQLAGYLDGSEEEPEKDIATKDNDGKEVKIRNPEYTRWIAQDQSVLGYLLRNMTREVLVQVAGLSSAREVWMAVTEMFSSVSKARIVHLRTQLNQTRKENRTGQAYFGRIKSLADEMANAGKKLDDEDIISYILAGLDDRYDGFVAAITALIKAEKHVGTPTVTMECLVKTLLSMLLNVVVATGIVADIEVAVVVATTSKTADVAATMVVAEAMLHSTTMVAAETTTLKAAAAGTISSSNNAKEGVVAAVRDQMLFVRYVAEMDIQRSDVGNASTKNLKDQNGLLEWW
ncbi:hypothetical protein QYE76_028689 [Lolium multiflorum]|uniref:Retrotransposon Copia-like N-terminal domain-containing protein n=1 Tax=Lolium multiflorum TaxID=4521 RepID=A0AAD8VHA9_LOLMU|nr:hypothetical protein QYE76_028581 [Lolium multiflorum]KAK1605016.1 hypothetical protein QYE76_028689 [Lolium multiflorum]